MARAHSALRCRACWPTCTRWSRVGSRGRPTSSATLSMQAIVAPRWELVNVFDCCYYHFYYYSWHYHFVLLSLKYFIIITIYYYFIIFVITPHSHDFPRYPKDIQSPLALPARFVTFSSGAPNAGLASVPLAGCALRFHILFASFYISFFFFWHSFFIVLLFYFFAIHASLPIPPDLSAAPTQ